MKTLKKVLKNEDGLVAIEYGVIAVGIALAIVLVVGDVGTALVTMFNQIVAAL